MTHPALIERITRSLAYMLRHQPDQFDLVVDEFGFADLEDVVQALNERLGEPVGRDHVLDAVGSGDRQRYEVQGDRIRALYGHSIQVKPGDPSKPPELLYVGVSKEDADRARRYGLRPGRRSFLHLALAPDDALETGRRAATDYVVITVRALDAWEEGINFYDRKSLFLSDPIPTQYLEVGELRTDGYAEEEEPRGGPRRRDRGRPYPGRGPNRHPGETRASYEEPAAPVPAGGAEASEPAETVAAGFDAPRPHVPEPSGPSGAGDRPRSPEHRPGPHGRDRRGDERGGGHRPPRHDQGGPGGRGGHGGRGREDRGPARHGDDPGRERRDRHERGLGGDRPRSDEHHGRPEHRGPPPLRREEPREAPRPAEREVARSDDAGSFGLGVFEAGPARPATPPPAPPAPRPRPEPVREPEPEEPSAGGGFGAGI